jgi:hypothetical protein
MHYDPWVDSAYNRNKYQDLPGGEGCLAHEADNLTAIYESSVYKMQKSQASYRDDFTFITEREGH